MKIDVFLLCYNESLMIRHTLNHYLKFCHELTIIDNQSSDNSLNIIREEYPSVIIETFNTSGFSREDIQTDIKNICWKNSQADYVIVCDMDEFLYDESLELKLSLLNKHKPAICSIIGFEMFSKQFPLNYKTPITQQVKHGLRNYRFDKSIMFNPKKVKEINYDYGAHTCNPEFYNKKENDFLVEFKLLHYKYLGKTYLYKRHLNYSNRLSKLNILNTLGKEYRKGKRHIDKKFKNASKYIVQIIP